MMSPEARQQHQTQQLSKLQTMQQKAQQAQVATPAIVQAYIEAQVQEVLAYLQFLAMYTPMKIQRMLCCNLDTLLPLDGGCCICCHWLLIRHLGDTIMDCCCSGWQVLWQTEQHEGCL